MRPAFNSHLLAGLLMLLYCLPGSAQDLDRKITVRFREVPLGTVLDEISRRAEIRFSYSPQSVPLQKKITFSARNAPVKAVLDQVLPRNGIQWFVLENQVVLKPGAITGTPSAEQAGKVLRKFTVSGYIREKSSGEALIGANVAADNFTSGTTTNGYGFYSITLPEGDHSLLYSFLGFGSESSGFLLSGDTTINIEMTEAPTQMQEVVITSVDSSQSLSQPAGQAFIISRNTLARMPGFAGAADVIRALQAIPGVRTYGDGSSLYYVRGGNSDQNLLILDEIPIYNPGHLFGFFSAISPEAINDIKVYKGDFPAWYGDRLSSVIDIKSREGNMKRIGFSGNLGPYASSLALEGPILKDKSSFFVSGRLATLNWLNYGIQTGQSFDMGFYDVNAKLNLRAGNNDRLFVSFYAGHDNFTRLNESSYRTYGISWDNLGGSLRWNHVFSHRFFLNTTAGYSRYRYFLYISPSRDEDWNSSVSQVMARSDLTAYFNPKNTFRAGISLTGIRSDPGTVNLPESSAKEQVPDIATYNSLEYVLYLSNEQKIGNKLELDYGIRIPVWQDLGKTTVYYFDAGYNVIDTAYIMKNSSYDAFCSPEPRISISWSPGPRTSLRVGYTRLTQFLQLLSNATGPFTSMEIWAPAGPNIEPQKADQYSAGWFQKIFHSRLSLSLEAFYKSYRNHIDYKDHADLLLNPLMEGELRFGRAWAYGIELMLQKSEGSFTGWIGYTWSRSMVKTPDVNNGNVYPSSFDSPNEICINLSYNTYKRWSVTANWIYHTGSPYTAPTGFFEYNGYVAPLYGEKNNARLPDYHRLDLSLAYQLNRPGNRYRHTLVLTVYNVYGRLNPFTISYNRFMNDKGELVVPSDVDGQYQRVPTTLSVAGVIPSINYQFKF